MSTVAVKYIHMHQNPKYKHDPTLINYISSMDVQGVFLLNHTNFNLVQ